MQMQVSFSCPIVCILLNIAANQGYSFVFRNVNLNDSLGRQTGNLVLMSMERRTHFCYSHLKGCIGLNKIKLIRVTVNLTICL
jgi:hypothetical protein